MPLPTLTSLLLLPPPLHSLLTHISLSFLPPLFPSFPPSTFSPTTFSPPSLLSPSPIIPQFTDYRLIFPEFNVILLVVYLGILKFIQHRKMVGYLLDFISSIFLLWATFTRQFYLRKTLVGQWATDICSVIQSDKELIYGYLAVSVVSWVSSSFIECNSIVYFMKLHFPRVRHFMRREVWLNMSWSRWAVLWFAFPCTINSLQLTLVLWSSVQHSFEYVSQDTSVLFFLTLAALLRLLRQFCEGLTFIVGIASSNFKLKNTKQEKLMGRIAFSSLTLLVHSGVLTNAFSVHPNPSWSKSSVITLSSLIIDMLFQFTVFCWAGINSSCFASMNEFAENLSSSRILSRVRHRLHPCVRTPLHWLKGCGTVFMHRFLLFVRTLHSLLSWIFRSAITAGLWLFLVRAITAGLWLFLVTAFQAVVMFAVGSLHLVYFCTHLVVHTFENVRHAYVNHLQIHPEPEQLQQVYQEAHQEHASQTQQNPKVVLLPHRVLMLQNRDTFGTCCLQCRLLEENILQQQSSPCINNLSLDILPFPSSAFGAPSTVPRATAALVPVMSSTLTTAPKGLQVPLSQERDFISSELCRFAISPHTESSNRLQQTLPAMLQETIIAPSLPCVKTDDPKSMLVV